MKIGPEEIEQIALGAAVLGTGGGGDPFIGKLLALDAVAKLGPVEMIEPDEVDDEGLVIPSAMMGAPTVIVEKIPNGEESVRTVRALEAKLERRAVAIVPIEQGGLNSQIPIATSAKVGLPLADCDSMGRAFPELQMTSFHLHGIKATPMTLGDEKGNLLTLETIDNAWTERLARAATVQMGGSALMAIYPMTGAQLKEACVRGTVSLSMRIGQAIQGARRRGENPIEDVVELMKSRVLFRGKVVDLLRRTTGGFSRGEARFDGLDEYRGQTLKVEFQNENLVAVRDQETVASVPDLISVLDSESGFPITTEALRYGNRAVVIGSPCNEVWRTKKGLETVGPRYFGYSVDYVPVEKRG
jgi:hypothetical protein